VTISDIERVLAQHPGVHRAAVVRWELEAGASTLTAYVVPDPDYLDRMLADENDESRRLNQWRTVYDLFEKGKDKDSMELGLNTSIWNSSYTRKPIPAEQMREWCTLTVDQILSLNPTEALEIGCGTGPLLLRIAPRCRRYVGTDFSTASLNSLRRQIEKLPGLSDRVTLLDRAADGIADLNPASFDTVIMNSVVQCFPSTEYLQRVLGHIVNVTKPGGAVFIGDVRNLALLEAFAVSVELYQAPAELSVAELRQRIRRRLQQERELVISPLFFLALQQRYSQVSRVEIRPKLGESNNELMNFRYDVVLHFGSDATRVAEPAWLDWDSRDLTLPALGQLLAKDGPEILGITAVANARVEKDVAALEMLSGLAPVSTVGELREELREIPVLGVTPRSLWSLARECGYVVDMSCANTRSDGRFDVLFRKIGHEGRPTSMAVAWPQSTTADDHLPYVSDPSRVGRRRKLIQQLQEYTRDKLADNERPTTFVLMHALPLTAVGEPDRQRLPPPHRIFQ